MAWEGPNMAGICVGQTCPPTAAPTTQTRHVQFPPLQQWTNNLPPCFTMYHSCCLTCDCMPLRTTTSPPFHPLAHHHLPPHPLPHTDGGHRVKWTCGLMYQGWERT